MDTLRAMQSDHEKLATDLAADGVEFAFGAWVDVLGRAKGKLVPIDHLPNMLAGSERYTPRGMGGLGAMNPSEDECVALPDVETLRVLPWDKRIAFFNADLLYGGREPFSNCPRSILKRVVARAAELGLRFNLGVETEFYVYRKDRLPELVPLSLSSTLFPTPAYDVQSTLDSIDFLAKTAKYMQVSDFGLYSLDHEGGNGQYELDFTYADVLSMCDRLTYLRLLVRQAADECGGVVTFMPKPASTEWGSGAHMNMSIESIETGENLFVAAGTDQRTWQPLAMQFVAGLIEHAPALAALTCPSVNSYKRLVPRLADGSVSWAPVWAAYGTNNRSCMLRLPDNRPAIENRSVDMTANVYLASAFALAAGLEGIRLGLDPGQPVSDDTSHWSSHAREGAPHLPRTLLEAIDAFEADPLVAEVFDAGFVADYVEMKRSEWDDYHRIVTPWEQERYLLNI
jgi:glutamine synthetase